MGFFISFEGGEGSGKSTQAEILVARLVAEGIPVVPVREPGSTDIGNQIRRLLKAASMSPLTELLLFSAARAELTSRVISPALEANQVVVSDRFTDSTIAYQQFGRKLPTSAVEQSTLLSAQGIKPNLTILLDIPPEQALKRVQKFQMALPLDHHVDHETGRVEDEGQMRFENEPMAFHKRVRTGYKALVENEPDRWYVLDATQGKQILSQQVWEKVLGLLPLPH